MTKYTTILNDNNFYMCAMSDLKTTMFRRLSDENKRTLLNKYLCLLVDNAMPAGMPDFKIELRCDLIDDVVHLNIGTAYPFISKFDLNKEFDEGCVLNALGDNNLVLSGHKRTISLSDFVKTRVFFETEEHNNRLTEYLKFIADELAIFGKNNEIQCCIISNLKIYKIELGSSYPFLKYFITLKIDIEQPFSPDIIVQQLDKLTEAQLLDGSANCFVMTKDGQRFLETINILEKVLYCENKIKSLYFKDSFYNTHKTFSFFSLMIKTSELVLEFVANIGIQIYIRISINNLAFEFGESTEYFDSFTWSRTTDKEHDTNIVRNFFIIYLEKIRGYQIKDLKRELQLIEMEYI